MNDIEPTATWRTLRCRAELLRAIRAFFDRRGFVEVETPLLSQDVVADPHIDPIEVPASAFGAPAGTGGPRWLQTSPEAAMKRLMAFGGGAIYQITRSFRRHEFGAHHNPEFTIVEWYRRGDDLERGIDLLDQLLQETLGAPKAQRIEYRRAFQESLSIDPWEVRQDTLERLCREHGLTSTGDGTAAADDLLDFLLATRIVPSFPMDRPVVLWGYPASQAALAQLDASEPRRAERFELFYRGLELANGYAELTDAGEWERRARQANRRRTLEGKEPLPVDSRMLEAMRKGLPPCAGTALGFDRLVMADLEVDRIEEVIAFPWPRA